MKSERINIYGINFSYIDFESVIKAIVNHGLSEAAYICFPSTAEITKAIKMPRFKAILNNAFLTIPDGKFTEILARLRGYKKFRCISAFWLMDALLKTKLSHYFYGSNNTVLSNLKNKIISEYPNSNVLGYKSPPFLEIDEISNNKLIKNDIEEINKLKPDIIWVSLSAPKQEFLMYNYYQKINHGLMIGVGGVFLYMSGTVKKSPEWVKAIGLRWLYRLVKEPKRLWKSTIINLFDFIKLILRMKWQ